MKNKIISFIKQFGFALIFTGAAVLIRILFFHDLGRGIAYLTFYPTVALVALYGTFTSGILVTIFSFFLTYLWIQQGHLSGTEWMAEAVFVISCILISFVGGEKNKAMSEKEESRKELEVKRDELESNSKKLIEQNEKLTNEIYSREKAEKKVVASDTELTKKVEELEKINKMMIDREIKMIDLKKENEELKTKLGNK